MNLKKLSPAPLKIRTMTITCKTSHQLDYYKEHGCFRLGDWSKVTTLDIQDS